MKIFLPFLLCITLHFQTTAQDQNYLFTNFSCAFFGTGDLSGTALGIDYHRTVFNRFGIHVGYSKADGRGDNNLFGVDLTDTEVPDLFFEGNGTPSSNLASYQTLMLGLNYALVDNQKSVFLVSVGGNFKNIQNNYLLTSLRGTGTGESILTIENNRLLAENEVGIYGGVDYLYVLDNSMTLGLHVAVENSDNILSKMGMSVGFRF